MALFGLADLLQGRRNPMMTDQSLWWSQPPNVNPLLHQANLVGRRRTTFDEPWYRWGLNEDEERELMRRLGVRNPSQIPHGERGPSSSPPPGQYPEIDDFLGGLQPRPLPGYRGGTPPPTNLQPLPPNISYDQLLRLMQGRYGEQP